ncbi:MAG: hypothetical protein KGR26_13205 [Cyanobacteria bacterium REEB65]|nr:hypothetical protein [Cyanobacteria bacterium REEB65]
MAGTLKNILLGAAVVALAGCATTGPLALAGSVGNPSPETPDGAVTMTSAQLSAAAGSQAARSAASSATAPAAASKMSAASAGGVYGISASSSSSGASGGMALQFSLQSLPQGTSKVTISVSAPGLSSPINQTITSGQFVNGMAEMDVNQMPVGSVTVSATAYDSSGNALGSGTSTGQISQNQTTDIQLVLMVTSPTGNLAVAVDSQQATTSPQVVIP